MLSLSLCLVYQELSKEIAAIQAGISAVDRELRLCRDDANKQETSGSGEVPRTVTAEIQLEVRMSWPSCAALSFISWPHTGTVVCMSMWCFCIPKS